MGPDMIMRFRFSIRWEFPPFYATGNYVERDCSLNAPIARTPEVIVAWAAWKAR
jgi:hypothetical protein